MGKNCPLSCERALRYISLNSFVEWEGPTHSMRCYHWSEPEFVKGPFWVPKKGQEGSLTRIDERGWDFIPSCAAQEQHRAAGEVNVKRLHFACHQWLQRAHVDCTLLQLQVPSLELVWWGGWECLYYKSCLKRFGGRHIELWLAQMISI